MNSSEVTVNVINSKRYKKSVKTKGGCVQNTKAVSKLVLIGVLVIVVIVSSIIVLVVFRPGARAAPDFEISANPTSISISQGGSGNITITIKSLNGFNSTVSFWGTTGTDIGYYIYYTCPSVTPPPDGQVTTTLTLYVDSDAPTGNYYINLRAESETPDLTHTVLLDFTVTASP